MSFLIARRASGVLHSLSLSTLTDCIVKASICACDIVVFVVDHL